MLSKFLVLDYKEWASSGASLEAYRVYVLDVLSKSYLDWWSPVVLRHRAQVPYGQVVSSPGSPVVVWREWALPATSLIQMRSLCRLRCGQLALRHLQGARSNAVFQYCIFCDERVRNATVHCLSSCSHGSFFRADAASVLGVQPNQSRQAFALHALQANYRDVLIPVCAWSSEIDKYCY